MTAFPDRGGRTMRGCGPSAGSGRHEAKPTGAVLQRLDGGHLPLTAATRLAFVHPLQLGGDIPQRQLPMP
jgi:hypothetical protein